MPDGDSPDLHSHQRRAGPIPTTPPPCAWASSSAPICSIPTRTNAASPPTSRPIRSSYLGACDISLNELTGIYATFADQGVWVRQHIVVQVKDDKDRVIYQYKPEGHRVFSPQVARQVTGMMQNVLDFGTGAPVRAGIWLHRARRGQDRHDQRLQGCLVRGIHHPSRRRASGSGTTSRARSCRAVMGRRSRCRSGPT